MKSYFKNGLLISIIILLNLDFAISYDLSKIHTAKDCVNASIDFYHSCINTLIARGPHFAIRYAGRSWGIGETCHNMVLLAHQKCLTRVNAIGKLNILSIWVWVIYIEVLIGQK